MKKKNKAFLMFSIITSVVWISLLMTAALNGKLDLGLSGFSVLLMGVVAILCFITSIVCFLLYTKRIVDSNEDIQIEEHDERNKMIRGKAAEYSILILTVLMVIVEGILMILGDSTAALLVAIATSLGVFSEIVMIGYLQKKY